MSLWKFGDFEADVDFTDADFLDAIDEAKAAMHEAEQNVPVVGKNSDIIRAQCACFYVSSTPFLVRGQGRESFAERTVSNCAMRRPSHYWILKQQKQRRWTANTISICQTRTLRSSFLIHSHSQAETVSREETTRNSMVRENIPIPEGSRA